MTYNDQPQTDRQIESVLNDPTALAVFVEGMAAADPELEQTYWSGLNGDEFAHSSGFWVADQARKQAEMALTLPRPTRRPRQQSATVVINASMRSL